MTSVVCTVQRHIENERGKHFQPTTTGASKCKQRKTTIPCESEPFSKTPTNDKGY
jgi:hypothetical protein